MGAEALTSFWHAKRVCVTGAAGFIGSFLVENLLRDGAIVTAVARPGADVERLESIKDDVRFVAADLTDPAGAASATEGQEVVLHLAAKVADIQYNRTHHADMFSLNSRLTEHVLEAASRNGVGRFLVVSSACVYPADARVPTPEEDGDHGAPEPENAGYGWSKRMAELLAKWYSAESEMEVAVCRPFNVYGPRDHWFGSPHVVPALIKRVMDGDDPVVVWGSGNQRRTFLHVQDAARGMQLIAEKAPPAYPINLGTVEETSVRELVELILEVSGLSPRVVFDTSKPDGYARRAADITRLQEVTGWVPGTSLATGIKELVEEYRQILDAKR